ncbi:MAG TPA: DUF6263 family protein [Saprospiraceae bacterium]|nr:DUF6263 family protein [Saprospiraceae bacterium]
MKNQFLLLAAGLMALWVSSCAPARQLSIQGAYRPGQQIHYKLVENTVTSTEALEGELEIPATTTTQEKVTEFSYIVKSVRPDNSIDMDLKFTHIYDRENDDKGETEYDTDHPIPDSLIDISAGGLAGKALAYNTLIGRNFQMRLSPEGKVLSIKGMNEAWDEIEERFMEQSPLAGSMLKNMKKQFGDEAMRSGQNDYWGYLPGKKVRVGQTWKKPYEFASFGLAGTTAYTLKSFDARQARITFSTKIGTEKDKPGIIDMGMIKIRYNLQGKGSGNIQVDQPYATIRTFEQTLSMTGPMEVKTSFTDWIMVPITVTVNSRLERVEK